MNDLSEFMEDPPSTTFAFDAEAVRKAAGEYLTRNVGQVFTVGPVERYGWPFRPYDPPGLRLMMSAHYHRGKAVCQDRIARYGYNDLGSYITIPDFTHMRVVPNGNEIKLQCMSRDNLNSLLEHLRSKKCSIPSIMANSDRLDLVRAKVRKAVAEWEEMECITWL